jgi:hypothetical protein
MTSVPSLTFPGGNKIKTNWFDRFENDKWNYAQRKRGIWTERANPASDASENPHPGEPSCERLNERKKESVDYKIKDRKNNDDGLDCVRYPFTTFRAVMLRRRVYARRSCRQFVRHLGLEAPMTLGAGGRAPFKFGSVSTLKCLSLNLLFSLAFGGTTDNEI